MSENRLERSDRNKIFEIIPINSLTEKSAAKWVTEIYIPVRPKKTTIRVKPVKNDTVNTIIESNFNFKVKQEDFIGIQTFGDLYNYIHSKISMQ